MLVLALQFSRGAVTHAEHRTDHSDGLDAAAS